MKVLVTAASRHGATLEIANAVRSVLTQLDIEVDVIAPEEVAGVDGYDAAVIGSGVYAGHWLAPARDLIEREAAALARKPVWLFSSGPIGSPPKPAEPPKDAEELAQRIGAREHHVFEGKLDANELGFAEKAILHLVRSPTGDYRPWDSIVDWARGIAASLNGARLPAAVAVGHP